MSNIMNNQIMKYCIGYFSLFCLVMLSSLDMYATHIVGGDITYQCLGDDNYEITLTIRRDCENGLPQADFDDPVSIGVFDPVFGNLLTQYGNFGQILIPFSESDTLNETIVSDCGFIGSQVCVEETIYKTITKLPYRPRGLILAHQRCCRNITLNNIIEPLATGSTYYIEVKPEALTECNSSPTFDAWADLYICANQDLNFSLSATDIDGDSLVYRLCTPSTGASAADPMPQPASPPPYSDVQFSFPFTLENMMGGVPLQINSKTGQLTANPNLVGQYLIGVCVDEYRNGKLLSSVRRDFEYNVRVCSVGPEASYSADSPYCGTSEVSFLNTSTNADSYIWYFDFPSTDPAFTSTELNPTFNYPSSGLYNVRLEAKRAIDGCVSNFSNVIAVSTSELDAEIVSNITNCDGNTVTLELSSPTVDDDPVFDVVSYNWSVNQAGSITTFSGQSIDVDILSDIPVEVSLTVTSNSGCFDTEILNIANSGENYNTNFLTNFTECQEGGFVIEFSDISDNPPLTTTAWNWTIIDNGNSIISDQQSFEAILIDPSSATALLEITLSNGCKSELYIDNLDIIGLPNIDFEVEVASCDNTDLVMSFSDNSDHGALSPIMYNWTIVSNSGTTTNLAGSTVSQTFLPGEILDINLSVTYSNGCVLSLDKNDIDINNVIDPATFDIKLINCNNQDGSSDYNVSLNTDNAYDVESVDWVYTIDGLTPISATGNTITIGGSEGANVAIDVVVNYTNGCTESAQTSFIIESIDLEVIDNNITLCQGMTTELIQNGNPNWTYSYSPETGLDLKDPHNPLFIGDASSIYEVTVSNGNCSITESVSISIVEQMTLAISGPTISCDGNVELLVTGAGTNANYEWSETSDFSNIIATGNTLNTTFSNNEQIYFVRVNGSVCEIEIASFTVKLNDIIFDTISDIEACNGDEFILYLLSDDSNIQSITWDTNPHITSGADTSSPTISIGASENTNFNLSYTIIDINGCSTLGSVLINVLEQPQLNFTSTQTCGTTTVCFSDLDPQFGQELVIDMTTIISVTNTEQCYEFNAFGSYEVLLQGVGITCAGQSEVKTIIVNESVDLTITGDTVSCDGLVQLEVSGGPSNINYEWATDSEFNNVIQVGSFLNTELMGATGATYYVQIEGNENCESEVDSVRVQDGFFELTFETPLEICIGDTIAYSVFPDPSIMTTIQWNSHPYLFGGANTTMPMIGIPEADAQDFSLSFTATSILGCTKTMTVDFIIRDNEKTSFMVDASCGDLEVCFTNTTSNQNGNYTWDFGDGSPTVIANDQVCHTYTSFDMYDVTLTNDSELCQNSSSTQTINLGEAIDIIYQNMIEACPGDQFDFTVLANDPNYSIEWSSSPIIIAGNDSFTPSIMIPADQTEDVALSFTVTNEMSCSESYTLSVDISQAEQFDFTTTQECGSLEICFTANLPDLNLYVWDIETSPQLKGETVCHTFPTGGSYTVTLSTTGNICNPIPTTQTITVEEPITIDFISDPITVCLGNTSEIIQNGNSDWTYTWSPTTGLDLSDPSNPIFNGTTSTGYSVTVTNGDCTESASVSVNVVDEMELEIIGSDISCDGSVELTVIGAGNNANYEWSIDPDFNTIIATGNTLNTSFAGESETYYVSVNGSSCTIINTSLTITLNDIAFDALTEIEACNGDEFILNLLSDDSNVQSITWDANPHIILGSDTTSPTISIGASENTDFGLSYTIIDINECSNSGTVLINVSEQPLLGFSYAQTCGTTTVCFSGLDPMSGQELVIDMSTVITVTDIEQCYDFGAFGAYDVVLQGTAMTCAGQSDLTTIIVNEGADLTITGDTVSCDGLVLLEVAGGPSNINYEWATDINFNNIIQVGSILNTDLMGATGATYYVQIEGNENCESEIDSIRVQDGFFELTFETPFQICVGDTIAYPVFPDPSIMTTIQWNSHPYLFGGANTTMPMIGIPEVGAEDFSLSFTATSILGCTKTMTVDFIISESVETSFTSDSECGSLEVCYTNTSTNLVGEYSWNFGDGSPVVIANEQVCHTYPALGTYNVTLSHSSLACQNMSSTQAIDVLDTVDLVITGETMICNNQINLVVTGAIDGDDYIWSFTNDFTSTVASGNTYTGELLLDSLTLYVSTAPGAICPGVDSITVFNDMFELSFLDPFEACQGDQFSYTVVSNDPSVVYQWEDSPFIIGGANTNMPLISIPADQTEDITLSFTASNGAGCMQSQEITIQIGNPSELSFEYSQACGGLEVCFDAMPEGLNIYLWSIDGMLPVQGQSICQTFPSAGTYMVTLSTIGNVCTPFSVSEEIVVTENTELIITGSDLTCTGFTDLNVSNGVDSDAFKWSTNPDFEPIIGMGSNLVYEMESEIQTFYVMTTDDASCADMSSFTVTNGEIMIDYQDSISLCNGTTTSYQISNLNPNQTLNIDWGNDPHIITSPNNNVIQIVIGEDEQESFEFNFTVSNNLMCDSTYTVFVDISNELDMDFNSSLEECGSYTICFENLNPESNVTYSWDFGDLTTEMDTITAYNPPCYTYPGAGTYTVTLNADSEGCGMMSIEKEIVVSEIISVNVDAQNISICSNDFFTINASTNVDATISFCLENGTILGEGPVLESSFSSDTVVLVKATDALGCSDTLAVQIDVFEFDFVIEAPAVVICAGDEFQISLINDDTVNEYTYAWEPTDCIVAGGNTATPTVSALASKNLSVTITNTTLGCQTTASVPISISNIDADILPDVFGEILAGEEVTLEAQGGTVFSTYSWSNDEDISGPEQTVSPVVTTTYDVIITDEFGCTGTASYTVTVREALCNEDDIYVPSAFSPNGDDVNDVLYVRSAVVTDLDFTIVDRWGKELFRSRNVNTGWDGTFNGERLAPDVYAYCVKATCINNETYVKSGNVSILR